VRSHHLFTHYFKFIMKIKSEPVKTVLTISTGFIVVFLITKLQWAIWFSLVVGGAGVFSTFLSKRIDFLWMKLTHLLSFVVPNIILSIVFYVFLVPISMLSKFLRKNDPLILKNRMESTFITTNKAFTKESFEKPW
jgi:hypothetical protein